MENKLLQKITEDLKTIGRSKIYRSDMINYCSDQQFWADFQQYWKTNIGNCSLIFSFNDLQVDNKGKYVIIYKDSTYYKKYYEHHALSNEDILRIPEEKRRKPWTW